MSWTIGGVAASAVAALFVVGAAYPSHAVEESVTHFDLGIDVTLLPQDKAGAEAFFGEQAPETQHVLRAACDNYVKHPIDAEMPQTIKFCQFILAPDRIIVPGILAPIR